MVQNIEAPKDKRIMAKILTLPSFRKKLKPERLGDFELTDLSRMGIWQ